MSVEFFLSVDSVCMPESGAALHVQDFVKLCFALQTGLKEIKNLKSAINFSMEFHLVKSPLCS